ncbi:hypothetical protein INS49_011090 [Diaporthe citri]|uniref:uncharacterized protein n=1 Tax=Diaporthe citri TaxID=83186 RepID=UPI001C8057A1|nr:uncharacterized protein INS49_011090 [Diaporthe citri]KAG6360034.1 hypothetical protein INS49_011090 [Diaporthe citri]
MPAIKAKPIPNISQQEQADMPRNHALNASPEPETFNTGAGGAGGFVKLDDAS